MKNVISGDLTKLISWKIVSNEKGGSMTSKIVKLTGLGQSIWYDDMGRRLLDNGELAKMIHGGDIRGLTSNPSIFNQAIAKSKDYDSALIPMAWAGYSNSEILEKLMVEDIQRVADLLRPLYDETRGEDGFVSLEVKPDLAFDTEKTIAEAKRLWKIVDRPNLMIKIPATKPGLVAIQRTIEAGINVNITLIFSIDRYKEVMDAYLSGLEARINMGKKVDHINSVASFFISRIDSKADKYLEAIIQASRPEAAKARSLLGKTAIANARLAYQEFRNVFEGARYSKTQAKGAKLQRPLWASTSTKNPSYPDTMYVDELIGEYTVNTVPPQTLDAFREHGKVNLTIEKDLDEARNTMIMLEEVGVSMQRVTQELESEGVKAFSTAYDSLLTSVSQRQKDALNELGSLGEQIFSRVNQLQAENFPDRFFAKDASLWTDDPRGQQEVRSRMDWLYSPVTGQAYLPELQGFLSEVKQAGYTHVLLIGMGGSSLAPEVMSLIYGESTTGLKFSIIDSTDPAQVLHAARKNPTTRTLFIISSKSGGTAEVTALSNYFWERTQKLVGNKAGEHFVAITDPGTSLEKMAIERKFRRIFLAEPNVGGRYSALTVFGLVPAALMGLNLEDLLGRAQRMASECSPSHALGRNPGMVLGVILAEAFKQHKDKLTIIADPEIAPFGSWLEQLIAESSGKLGKGIVPIHGEPLSSLCKYGTDRLFVYLRRDGKYDSQVNRLRQSRETVITQEIPDNAAIASEFYKWEVATATACSIIGVNAFDQPDVQDSKTRTLAKIAYYKAHRTFSENRSTYEENGMRLYDKKFLPGLQLADLVREFLVSGKQGEYIAINAYLMHNNKNENILQALRKWIKIKTGLATMVGFGPRFLHSTGQLHKGGANNGLFLVITADPVYDLEIPREGLSFGTLEYGQALGDLEALKARERRLMHLHLSNPGLLKTLIKEITLD